MIPVQDLFREEARKRLPQGALIEITTLPPLNAVTNISATVDGKVHTARVTVTDMYLWGDEAPARVCDLLLTAIEVSASVTTPVLS